MHHLSGTPEVSVVLPALNQERFLSAAIESILDQTFENFELIIIDDGSRDGTAAIAETYRHKDSRIVLLSGDHQGLVHALNWGCAEARAPLIARMDGDDIAIPNRLERHVAEFKQRPQLALLGGGIVCTDEQGAALFTMRFPKMEEGLRDYLLLDCCISHPTIMFRNAIFKGVGGYRSEYVHAEDYDLFLRISDSYEIDNDSEVVCLYRLHPGQVSAQQIEQQVVSGVAAKLATRARRAGNSEPAWMSANVSKNDLRILGVSELRLSSLIRAYKLADASPASGWRWANRVFKDFIYPPDATKKQLQTYARRPAAPAGDP